MLTNRDYCDYDTCVALKELGYSESFPLSKDYEVLGKDYDILLYEAQKWLREKKLLHIVIDKLLYGAYEFSVVDILNYSEETNGTANSYEEALSEGIREAVKILKEK
jgi:hypothetical protein